MSPVSEQKVNEPGLCRRKFRMSRPFFLKKMIIGKYQDLVDRKSVSTSQIIHDGFLVLDI